MKCNEAHKYARLEIRVKDHSIFSHFFAQPPIPTCASECMWREKCVTNLKWKNIGQILVFNDLSQPFAQCSKKKKKIETMLLADLFVYFESFALTNIDIETWWQNFVRFNTKNEFERKFWKRDKKN